MKTANRLRNPSTSKNLIRRFIVEAPAALRGKERVSLSLTCGFPDRQAPRARRARIEQHYPYQFKQMAAHLDERFRREKLEFTGKTVRESRPGRATSASDTRKWIRDSVTGPCPLEPRLLERQVGPTCVRDKIAIQTEPGMWLPSYVVYPKKAPKKMPALILSTAAARASWPIARQNPAEFIPDSTHELYGMPYALCRR